MPWGPLWAVFSAHTHTHAHTQIFTHNHIVFHSRITIPPIEAPSHSSVLCFIQNVWSTVAMACNASAVILKIKRFASNIKWVTLDYETLLSCRGNELCKRTTIKIITVECFFFTVIINISLKYITMMRFTNIEQTNEWILARRYTLQSKAVKLFLIECGHRKSLWGGVSPHFWEEIV